MNKKGFTLLEVMVSVSILSAVGAAVSILLLSSSQELSVNMPAIDVEIHVDRTMNRMRAELADASASMVTVAADGSWVSFAVPVMVEQSWGAGGDRHARYGARLGRLETSGGLNALVFTESMASGVSPVSEATVVSGGININTNTETTSDTSDVFTMGNISLVYDPDGSFPTLNGDEVTRPLTGDWVAQVDNGSGILGKDVSGDGTANPLFAVNGSSVEIDLWGLTVVRSAKTPIMVNGTSTLALRNP